MSTGRRIATILGWSAGLCVVTYVAFVAYIIVFEDGFADGGTTTATSSDIRGSDIPSLVIWWFLVASPVTGGIIGVVRAVRGATNRDKVIWSLIGAGLIAASWFVLANIFALVSIGLLLLAS